MQITDLEVGQKISFEVYPAHIFGNTFNNVTITAFFDYHLANALGLDIVATHNTVYPTLPPGTPNDATQYNYMQVKLESGDSITLGLPWLVSSTIRISGGRTLKLTFQDIDDTRRSRIMMAVRSVNENPDNVIFE